MNDVFMLGARDAMEKEALSLAPLLAGGKRLMTRAGMAAGGLAPAVQAMSAGAQMGGASGAAAAGAGHAIGAIGRAMRTAGGVKPGMKVLPTMKPKLRNPLMNRIGGGLQAVAPLAGAFA